jgi:hypothetical protein
MKQGVKTIKKKVDTTGIVVTGVGALVSGVGTAMRRSKLGIGILGFGLAHVALGLLDMLRPTIKNG